MVTDMSDLTSKLKAFWSGLKEGAVKAIVYTYKECKVRKYSFFDVILIAFLLELAFINIFFFVVYFVGLVLIINKANKDLGR